jgi:sec-independent protein translocase protein TatC
MPRPSDDDLFVEEQSMPTMSFGDHIEDLRKHLILAVLGLVVGVLITFIPILPPWNLSASIGGMVLNRMQKPAQDALDRFKKEQAERRAAAAEAKHEYTPPAQYRIELADLALAMKAIDPALTLPAAESLKGQAVNVSMQQDRGSQIRDITNNGERARALIQTSPLETFGMLFMVCLVTGLVISSPWVFYQVWLFISAGLYRHERAYVMRFLPFALGLFLGGVALCFFIVLPVTLDFLLSFNTWLDIEPMFRITDWIGFATMLPLIFGLCFQTPIVMLIIERIGIISAADMRAKRKIAILIMVIAAAIITPTQDPFSLSLLAVPMVLLYELGLVLIGKRGENADVPAAVA